MPMQTMMDQGKRPELGSAAHMQRFKMQGPENEIKLFVGGLAYQTKEHDIMEYFAKFGQVIDAIVMRDQVTQKGRGFGFVKIQFDSQQTALINQQKVLDINHTHGHEINGKRVDVKSTDNYVKPANKVGPIG